MKLIKNVRVNGRVVDDEFNLIKSVVRGEI